MKVRRKGSRHNCEEFMKQIARRSELRSSAHRSPIKFFTFPFRYYKTPERHYESQTMPRKYFRKKHGRGFRYVDDRGYTVKDQKLKAWFGSLVIPPAWTDVEISAKESANLLVTGRDQKGRKQYIYHPDYVTRQEQKKFERLLVFGEKLEMMREKVTADLRKRKLGREKVLAAMVRLMDE